MRQLFALPLILYCTFSFASEENMDPQLEKLIEEVKLARINRGRADLPDGIHSIEGFMSSGLFYPCSSKYGLHLSDTEGKEVLENSEQLKYVEFTAKFSNGVISIIEVHTVSNEPLSSCEFKGQDDGT